GSVHRLGLPGNPCGPCLRQHRRGRCGHIRRCPGSGAIEHRTVRPARPRPGAAQRSAVAGAGGSPLRPDHLQPALRQRTVDEGTAARIPARAQAGTGGRRRRHGPGAPHPGRSARPHGARRPAGAGNRPRARALRGCLPRTGANLAGHRRHHRPDPAAAPRAAGLVIRAAGLTLRRGVKVLLENAEFVVHPGERVGIVGKNGAGKSSLFSLLQGEIDPDAGSLDMPASWRLASVEQILHDTGRPARDFVIDGDRHLRARQARRAALDPDQGQAIAELEAALVEAGAWSAPSRAEQLLAGLGFAPDEWTRPVASFSGGWQMRIALARALMAPSDLLLLDEPTNHLDLDAMLWLERWLAGYPGTVLLISHDTEFLDAVARVILHFEQDKLVRYKGGYESFLEQRAERLRQNRLAIQRQARETAHLQSFIDRFKAKATKAKQ